MHALTDRRSIGRRIALVSPGQLGADIAAYLVGRGFTLVSPLAGRSERTRDRAREVGIVDGGSVEATVHGASVVISMVPPDQALAVAWATASALRGAGTRPLYVDANSISPRAVVSIGRIVEEAGARFVDAAIIAPTPRTVASMRIYASGPGITALAEVASEAGLQVVALGDEPGRASALRMAYSCLAKGLSAASVSALILAASAGLTKEFTAELVRSQPELAARLPSTMRRIPRSAARWVGEADEIAQTMGDVGLPPGMFHGVAAIFRIAAVSDARGGAAGGQHGADAGDGSEVIARLMGALAHELGR